MKRCEFESENGECLINECMYEPHRLCDKVRLNIYKELENDLKNSVNLELYELGRRDAIDECIEIIAKIMPTEPFLKNSKHYENWRMKTTELRMLRDMLEQLKEKQDDI